MLDDHDVQTLTIPQLAHVVGYCYQNPDHQITQQTVCSEVVFGHSLSIC